MAHTAELHPQEQLELGALGPKLMKGAFAVGGLGLVVSAGIGATGGDGFRRFFFAYLVAFTFFLSLALGGLFFTMLQHLVRAHWSVVVRRIAEVFASTLPLLAVLGLVVVVPMLAGNTSLYLWTTAEAAQDHLIHSKQGFLNVPFFTGRYVVYFVVLVLLSRSFIRRSIAQDESGDAALSDKMSRMAGPGMIAFAFALAFTAYDLLMSLHPAWFSTMFGVYYFAGCALIVMACLILTSLWLQGRGRLTHSITVEHYHDMGKLLFAFVFFWGYIAFSQFMLIWYADIPEETAWYGHRIEHGWMSVSMVLLFGHFIVPFVFLLSRHTKRRMASLAGFAVWLFAMHYVDLFWLVMPEYDHHVSFSILDLTTMIGVGGLFVGMCARTASKAALLPKRDPRLGKSLAFENV